MPLKLPCRVAEIIDHGDHVYSVVLRPQVAAPRFLAGQFLHVALDAYQPGDFWPDSRPFSIASSPADRRQLRITYAVKGAFTARMEQELRPEREVWIKLPYGEFTVDLRRDACLLAGGTGITAFTALLGQLPADHARRVQLFYGARQPDLLIYRRIVEEMTHRCSHASAHLLVEHGAEQDASLVSGRVDVDHVWPRLQEPFATVFYVAGPPAMIDGLRTGLEQRGVSSDCIKVDAWE